MKNIIVVIFGILSMCAIVMGQTSWPPPTNYTAQLATWNRQALTGSIPPREYQSVVYDPNFNRLIIFGGRTAFEDALNDIWFWSFPSRRFIQLPINGTGDNVPVARSHHVAGLDVARSRMIIFGGKDTNGNTLGDMWQLNLLPGREAWTRLTTGNNGNVVGSMPSPRWGASGGIFNGATFGSAFYVAFGKSGFSSQRGDVLRFELATNTWSDVTGSRDNLNRFVVGDSQGAPAPRHSAQATLLGPDTMMIYGGCASGGWGACPEYDIWDFVFDNVTRSTTWVSQTACPIRSYNGQAAPFPGSGSSILPRETKFLSFGGYGGVTGDGFHTQQILEIYDTASILTGADRWTRTQLQAVTNNRLSTPGPRVGGSMVLVHPPFVGQSRDFLVLFGGRDNNTIVRSDLWYLEGQTLFGRRFRCASNTNFRMIHGILMFLSFGVFFPSMVILARFGKDDFLPAIRDKSPWLWGHAIVNIIGAVLTIPALVLATVAVNSGSFTAIPHAYLGIIAFVLVIFNPIWGAFKPDKDSDKRPAWAYVHMWVGRVALLLGFINMLLGIMMARSKVVIFALYIVYVIIFLFVYILLEVLQNKKKGIGCAEALNPKYNTDKYDY